MKPLKCRLHGGLVITALLGAVLLLSVAISGLPAVQAQGVEVTSAGALIEEQIINGPPEPPPGFDLERAPVALPMSNKITGLVTLTVPAYNWVFGCSSVSGAMIAGYYDRNGYTNMYAGPTDGGVMPLDNSSWPTWSDGYKTYPNLPLAASHQGVDGRATRGSIDDYWVQYDSSASDPYITGGWAQHDWGDAIGDYMKTSQSAYSNTDGSTTFYNWTSSANQLTCSDMVSQGISTKDGTYGRKLFYEARGYTVTDCYNQKTDNNGGGFTFANYKAEIDAGRPVMINLVGHTVVGVGYDDAGNTVYIHDTWDYNDHTMPWGGSYSGMALQSVSIVNLQGAGPVQPVVSSFNINSGAASTTSTAVTLNNTVTGSTPVLYMASESASFTEASWQTYSTAPSFTLSSGYGMKSVFFKVKDGAGTESAAAYDGIELAAPAPPGDYTMSTTPYSFEDISATGTDLNLYDDSFATLSIPFSFNFYGTAYSAFSVSSNGTLNFQDEYLGLSNTCIPDINSYGVEKFVALFWDDLDPGWGGAVYYQVLGSAPNRRVIVQWSDVPQYYTVDGGTFQVVLYEGSNDIVLRYQDVDFGDVSYDQGLSATVGIQRDSTTGLQYSCNTAALTNNLAIRFSPGRKGKFDPILNLLLD